MSAVLSYPDAPPELVEVQNAVHLAYAMMPGYAAVEGMIDSFFQIGLHCYMEWMKVFFGDGTLTFPLDDGAE